LWVFGSSPIVLAPNSVFRVSTTLNLSGESSWMMWSVPSRVAAAIKPVQAFVERPAGQQLQRHNAVQHFISRAIHDTHTAFANLCNDSVVIQRLSDHGCGQPAILSRPQVRTGHQQPRNGPQTGLWEAEIATANFTWTCNALTGQVDSAEVCKTYAIAIGRLTFTAGWR
jgi:hypothetical protein